MIDNQIKNIADDFVRALQHMPEVIAYSDALSKYEADEDLTRLTEKYNILAEEFQKKQYEGTLTQEEISILRTLAGKIQNNTSYVELADKQNLLKIILQECNGSISNEISMDFVKLAAPSVC